MGQETVAGRDVLPIPDIPPPGLTTYDAKDPDTTYPPIEPLRPPAGAPNVLIVLIDDVGFGASSAFGGPCRTPNFERLAAGGLKYNRFHTTALCSPTRSALLTGRNHHSVGMGNIAELATSAPGNSSIWPNTAAPLAKILQLNEVPVWETGRTTRSGRDADLGILDDTLLYVIIGDNGASAEGSLQGTFNEMITLGGFGALETSEFMASKIDLFGGPEAYNHYAVGWAHAMDTPYQWTKQVASHWGGTRNGTIVHWPSGITAKGEVRSHFHHVIDVAPTVLEAARLPAPLLVNGVQQKPLEGVSMRYSFNAPNAPERHETQYFEMFGNRGIYHKGWTAVTKHRTPWETGVDAVVPAFDDDIWELYDTNTDWSQARDLAKEHPGKLAELQRLWLIEAVKYNVVPLDDRFVERGLPETAGRPTLIKGKRQLLFGGMGRLTENSVVMMKNTSFSITADITVKGGDAPEGVLLAQGGVSGGHSLYVKAGKPRYCYNFFGLERYYAEGTRTIPEGNHQVRMEFTYDGGGVGKGGTATLYIDGVAVGDGRIDQTEAFLFSADETCDVGDEYGSPVTTDYSVKRFTGEVNWVELDLGLDDHNHLIKPEDRVRVAMGIQ